MTLRKAIVLIDDENTVSSWEASDPHHVTIRVPVASVFKVDIDDRVFEVEPAFDYSNGGEDMDLDQPGGIFDKMITREGTGADAGGEADPLVQEP